MVCVMAALRGSTDLEAVVADRIHPLPLPASIIDGSVGGQQAIGIALVRNTPNQTLEGNVVLVRSVWSVLAIAQDESADNVAVTSKLIFLTLQNMRNISDVMKNTPYGLISSCTWVEPTYMVVGDQEQKIWQHMGAQYEFGVQGLLPLS